MNSIIIILEAPIMFSSIIAINITFNFLLNYNLVLFTTSLFLVHLSRANTRREYGGDSSPPPSSTPPYSLTTNQTKIPYPKPLRHWNKTRLNESENNSLKIIFLVIKTHFGLIKAVFSICVRIKEIFILPPPFHFC